jgi:hypothetical protein
LWTRPRDRLTGHRGGLITPALSRYPLMAKRLENSTLTALRCKDINHPGASFFAGNQRLRGHPDGT